MNRTGMFNFDPSLLDDPEFKEDSVREEIIVPILKRLGYSASGPYKIVRSKALLHPFVMIGSKKHTVTIVPDYLLHSEGRPALVLDAKRLDAKLVRSKHAEQAYSYAIHPDVRVRFYALCSGHQLVAYDIYEISPIFEIDFADIERQWDVVDSVLSPKSVAFAPERFFAPDFGTAVMKMSPQECIQWQFHFAKFSHLCLIDEGMFTLAANIPIGNIDHMASFDMPREVFAKLLSLTDHENREHLLNQLAPGRAAYSKRPIFARLDTFIGSPTQGQHDVFIPFIVQDVFELKEDDYHAFEALSRESTDYA
jgi:hypothetical protein